MGGLEGRAKDTGLAVNTGSLWLPRRQENTRVGEGHQGSKRLIKLDFPLCLTSSTKLK